jgi:ribonuclease BN (tRNA processing enzyme)
MTSLTFIGCGDAFGSGGRDHTCFHLTDGRRQMLVDCGASALPALKRNRVDCAALDMVVLSHLHGDHFGGVPFLLLDGLYATRRTRPLTIVGPPGVEARVLGTFELLFPGAVERLARASSCRFVEYTVDGEMVVDDIRIATRAVVHPSGAPSCALRISWGGRVVAYSGDTEWTDALVDIAAGADLFVCECYTYDKAVPYHLSYRTLLEKRPVLRAHRQILTHLGPQMLAHVDACEMEIAAPGLTVAL